MVFVAPEVVVKVSRFTNKRDPLVRIENLEQVLIQRVKRIQPAKVIFGFFVLLTDPSQLFFTSYIFQPQIRILFVRDV